MKKAYLGIEIGGTKIQIFVTNDSLKIMERIKFFVGDTKKASIILKRLKKHLIDLQNRYDIKAIGIGFGGPVNYEKGTIYDSFHVEGWHNFNLVEYINDLLQKPTFLNNDANIAALGEATLGAGAGLDRVFYITLGSGVGGGFVIDGKIYQGSVPGEFEVGHLCLSKKGKTMESAVSGWSLNNRLNEYIRNNQSGVLAQMVRMKQNDPSKNVLSAIENGDIKAKIILDETLDDLALGLSHIIHIVNPKVIVIGGGLANLGVYLTRGITNTLPKYMMPTLKKRLPSIRLTQLAEDAVPLGAILYAQQQLFKNNK